MKKKTLKTILFLLLFALVGGAGFGIGAKYGKGELADWWYGNRQEEVAESVSEKEAVKTPAPTPEPAAEEEEDELLWTPRRAKERLQEILDGRLYSSKVILDVPEIMQMPELPTGCETVALTIDLNALGLEMEKTKVATDYLISGSNWVTAFAGDPRSYSGGGVFPPGLLSIAEKAIESEGANFYAFNTTGTSLRDLYKFIEAGYPVIVWTTMYQDLPRHQGGIIEHEGVSYQWYPTEHCIVVNGYDWTEGKVETSDPLHGRVAREAESFERIFDEIGRFSIVILSEEGVAKETEEKGE